jgi:diguanylate cyclase
MVFSMANSNNTLQTPVQNWRDKYLALTEEQDALKQQHRKLVALLSRGVLRLSVLSDGLDDRLDACLGGLRRALRNQSTTLEQLTEIIDTLDGRIKVIAEKKSSRPVQLVKLLRVLVDQLRRITVQDSTLAKIKQFEQKLKHDDSSEHIASALNEMIQVQAAVFADIQSGIKPSPPFWARWFSSAEVLSDNKNKNTAEKSSHSSDLHANASLPECESMFASDLEMDTENNVNSMHDQQVMHDYAKDIAGREEPPFATINPAICLVLDELIRQIEPPLTAKENYLEARRLLNKGLNWFELVPLLENLSLVVVSAIDSSQKEFETYLNLLNERLQQAAEVLLQSDQANGERQQASLALQDSVNNTLDDLRKDVVETHDLDTLKAQVNNRIEAIVGAMSAFESAEKSHKISLGDQLNALAEKVREMEAQSKPLGSSRCAYSIAQSRSL